MEIVPVEYELSSMINDVVNMIRFRAEDKDLELVVNVLPTLPSKLVGDDVRIRQILMNLLTNAVKYTRVGTVWLRVSSLEGSCENIKLHFEVEDTGIGIKAEEMDKLFASFERIDLERNRNIEGTGLGMPITLRLLDLMGSALEVKSEYNKGSVFSFDLDQRIVDKTPVGDLEKKVAEAASDQKIYSEAFTAPDANILVVDDNSMNRKVFVALLKKNQINIMESENGLDSIALASHKKFDIIFMDHMMPGMDGVEAMKRIKEKKDGPCADTPIIVLTANAVAGAREKYLEDGFDGFLSKPVVSEKLEAVIREFLPKEMIKPAPAPEDASVVDSGVSEVDIDEFPVIFGIDWKIAAMRLGDRNTIDSILEEFFSAIDLQAAKLQEHREGIPATLGDYEIQVHGMKSTSGSVGIVPLSGMAAVLEKAAYDGDIATIEKLHDVFIAEWKSYKDRLREYLHAEDDPEDDKEEISDEILDVLLSMLSSAMESMDIDGADEAIEKLSAYRLPERVADRFEELKAAVTQLDQKLTSEIIADMR
jgi:CheY-like chemotaxis protein